MGRYMDIKTTAQINENDVFEYIDTCADKDDCRRMLGYIFEKCPELQTTLDLRSENLHEEQKMEILLELKELKLEQLQELKSKYL